MPEENRKVFKIDTDLQNGFRSHNELCKLASGIKNTSFTKISINLNSVNFIASNLFSVLGCIFSEYAERNPDPNSLHITGIHEAISDTMQKNGFCKHLGLKKKPDVHNTVIPYMRFSVDKIDEYERYLTLNLFTRSDLPTMTKDVSDNIRDYLLELFKNVSDHTTSNYVYTCGQYFPKSYMLYFTIVDIGETISYNVSNYHSSHDVPVPEAPLEWAITAGNTTSFSQKPRGIGLSLIKDFVILNNGVFFIVSDTETYEIQHTKERFRKLDHSFPGTIVTIGFNLRDNAIYYLTSRECDTIKF